MDGEPTKNTTPTVSVLMSVYNSERFLEESIRSILDQTFTDFEFLIVDDGSSDGSAKIIQRFAREDSRIVLLRNETNLGLTRSLNIGIRHACGRYLARQDADDISLPERFERQLDFLERHPAVGVLGTACKLIDDRGKVIGERNPALESDVLKRELLIKNFAINHSSVMVRTSIIRELGGYDERLRYAQDYDLWWKIGGIAELANLEGKLILWRSSGNQISSGARDEQLACMLEISLRIIRSITGGEAIAREPYLRLWIALNKDETAALLPEDIRQLTPLWEILSADGRFPPSTLNALENTAKRLYRTGNYHAARQLSLALDKYFGRRPGRLTVISNLLKSLLRGR